ncbi:hypothetical protein [Neorhizobium tomejilense]|uniref:hypothetical protein n=1 Tax=Neorhizobium tomejilense TaxID=2093828 RepID=UPI000CF849B1|nr:hypothetical protein [Neorhizobium tomejilense]
MKLAELFIGITVASLFMTTLPASAQAVGGGGGGGFRMAQQTIQIIQLSDKEVTPERFRQVLTELEGAENEKAAAIVVFDQMMQASRGVR